MPARKGLFYRLRPKSRLFYFSESVDSEDGEVGVSLGVAHDVEIDEFFELEWRGGDIFEDIHEEGWDIFPVCHVRNDAPNGLLLLVDVYSVQLLFKLSDFSGLFLFFILRCHILKFDDLIFKQ